MARKKQINLALQGGGAHGAFTWGVLDRLLQEPELEIAALSGTSAGAMNAAALKAGMVEGGAQAARDNLDWLWEQMGAINDPRFAEWVAPFAPPAEVVSHLIGYSVPFAMADAASRVMSPYFQGPLYQNPLRRIAEAFNYDKVCAEQGPAIFVSTTNVRSGKLRVFRGPEVTTDVLLASACLPTVFQAVEFEDPATGKVEAFWDGGYTGNPALFPFFADAYPDDIVIVNINPLHREALPQTPQDIGNRINEISFNTSLLRELRAINFVKRLIADNKIEKGKMKNVLVHMIADDALMNELSVATKMVPNAYVLGELKEAGGRAAETFLETDFAMVGKDSSVDLKEMFGDGSPGF